MDYIRSFDIGSLDAGRFDYQMLADLETCYVIVCRSPAGSGGPDTHVHDCDQFYYVLDGTMNVVFGETEYTAEPGSLVFIPQGTAHRNWTVGAQPETHIDILVPPPARGQAMSRPANPRQTGPSEPCVCRADEAAATSGPDGQVITPIAAPRGAAGMAVNVVRVGAAEPAASWHIHNFDQLYWILEGTLTVEIVGERHDVTPGNLVVLPAGVPHRNWNEAETAERHLAFLVPASAGQPVTRPVTFGLGAALRSWLRQDALGYTQGELAARLQRTHAAVSYWESGAVASAWTTLWMPRRCSPVHPAPPGALHHRRARRRRAAAHPPTSRTPGVL